ncbi:MAG: Hsp20/alpha crystallin family protein [Candidatus Thorarchaeota archaeon]|jgi:HSP20 family molecular chaperone IbpA
MIDDDEFQKIFRRMIEQFFGTFGMQPGGSGVGEMWDTPSDEMESFQLDTPNEDSRVERIDLEDSVILVMDECLMKDELQVSVRENVVTISYSPTALLQQFETSFTIDAERSHVTCRNGVAEIRLEKDEENRGSDNVERILRIE